MKLRSLPLLSLCLLLAFSNLVAQDLQVLPSSSYGEYMNIESRLNDPNSDVDGSPYLSKEWAPGEITFINNFTLKNVNLRFNVYKNFLEAYMDKTEYSVDIKKIYGFSYTDPSTQEKWNFRRMIVNKKDNSIVRVLSEGEITFTAYYEMRRTRGTREGNSFEALNPVKDVLALGSTYYMFMEGEPAIKVAKSRKGFLKQLPDHQKEMEEYMDKNKIDLRNDSDFMKACEFYNSIK